MIEDIYNWLNTAGVSRDGSPAQFKLWKELMLEELQEMENAFNNNDLEEMKDAYVDLIWANTNWSFMKGIPIHELQQKIDDVSKSNWSKFCKAQIEAEISVALYGSGNHPTKLGVKIETYVDKVGDWYIVKRLSDNKILKSHKFLTP